MNTEPMTAEAIGQLAQLDIKVGRLMVKILSNGMFAVYEDGRMECKRWADSADEACAWYVRSLA